MIKPAKGSLQSLDPSAKLFVELKKQNPAWWSLLCNDKEVYIHIRKDNYINAYYYGGSIIKLEYKRGEFVGETHHKYYEEILPNSNPQKTYLRIDLYRFDKATLEHIKKKISEEYSERKVKKENSEMEDQEEYSEKYIQGVMIINNPNIIDSEFQFNLDTEADKLRIDLTELSNGTLTFNELKLITDSRLSISDKSSNNTKIKKTEPDIIGQMKKYNNFIANNHSEIKEYYKKLLEIRESLGLNIGDSKLVNVSDKAKLTIINTYKHEILSEGKDCRIKKIEEVLMKVPIEYEIRKLKS
ncbi:MAG: hypothetical protein CVT97_06150 [Bacteroidetes bacterium HGW-Bacteroidetes-14]|jgi:hypothetical protein|nr:MAG: hypothetical protein CVT97_06150 [Bacteroidetes bacterium HGW-Bacteroidetes-14]